MAFLDVKHLVLKLTSSCNAQCYHCRDRQFLYLKDEKKFKDLPIRVIESVLKLSSLRGLEKVTLSGGEPTLGDNLNKIISLLNNYVGQVTLITNGWKSEKLFWQNLVKAGLTHVDISLDGYYAGLHDWLRNKRGLFDRILKCLKILREVKKDYSNFDYSVLTMVSTFNIMHLDKILRLLFENEVSRWVLHYPECDIEALFSPSAKKQRLFRKDVLPILTDLLKTNISNKNLLQKQIEVLKRLYNPRLINSKLYAEGIYHINPDKVNFCKIPGNFLLVKFDGILLACNGGEYSDEGIIGKVNFEGGAVELYENKLEKLIDKGMNYCINCPVPDSLRLYLR